MATRIIVRGASAQALGKGYFRETWPNIGGNSLHAAYLLGNAQKMTDDYDFSFHKRALTLVGDVASIRGAGFSTPNATNYYETPFTNTELMAAGTANEWTFCGVAKASMTSDGTPFSAENSTDTAGFRAQISTAGTFSAYAYDADGPAGPANAFVNATADAGEFEFFAITVKAALVKIYRKGNSTGFGVGTAVPAPGIVASGKTFRLGRRWPNTSYAGGAALAAAAFYNRVLTDAEVQDVVYPKIKAILAEFHGISI